jgi:hypothetical protein
VSTAGPPDGAGPVRLAFADPALTRRTPGEEFALAVGRHRAGADVEVPLRVALPATFPLAATRPRYTVRHLLKLATVEDGPVPYVQELPAGAGGPSGTRYAATPEAGFTATLRRAALTELIATMPVPAGLLDEPALLAAFVDHRVVVRLCTVENEALLHGCADGAIAGLLRLPGIRRGRLCGADADAPAGAGCSDAVLAATLTEAAAEVEETGGSCDGMVAHPVVYWRLVRCGLLDRLGQAGIRVSRTRMIARDQVLLADFRAAATLLDPHASTLRLRRAAGAGGADVIEASTRVGLAVHLPQHLLLLLGR